MENKQLKSFKDLTVWQKAADLANLVYKITEKFTRPELYGLTNQMRCSVVSISSNIAEGFKRNHKKEKLQFYNVAYGSVAELESQIEIALKLNFLTGEEHQKLNSLIVEVSKMIDALIKTVNKFPRPYILNSIFIFLYSIFYILNPISVEAVELKIISQVQEIGISQQFRVDLLLNAENEEINAVEGKILYPTDLLELKEIRDGNSTINFWIERPRSDSDNRIIFSGITPGGFRGENGLLFSLIFQVKQTGQGKIEFSEIRILKNDGFGTPANVSTQPYDFKIKEAVLPAEETIEIKVRDYEPPESFVPEIGRDEAIFDGKWFLVFATQDKGSGIARYEIQETRAKFFKTFKKWQIAESPYPLKDQELKSEIYVKAIDKTGNERIVALPPQNLLRWYENYYIWVKIIIGAIFVYIIWKILRKKKILHE